MNYYFNISFEKNSFLKEAILKQIIKKVTYFCFLAVAASTYLSAYDNSPDNRIIIPEVIWAAASGGGTWVSELQITDFSGGSVVNAIFHYGTSFRTVSNIWTSPGIYRSIKFTNILQYLGTIDTSFTYYGKVGALWLYTQDSDHKIQAMVRTVNGNYGKTFPGLRWVDANTANVGRRMVLQDLIYTAKYRTHIGMFNAASGGYSMTVAFRIISADNTMIGSEFVITLAPWEFKAINPFKEAGITSGSYENCWLWINPISCASSGQGLFVFGSTVNNYTNDTSAHIAIQFQ